MDAFERRLKEQLQRMPQLHFNERARAEVLGRVRQRNRWAPRFGRVMGTIALLVCLFMLAFPLREPLAQVWSLHAHREPIKVNAPITYDQHVIALSYAPLAVTHLQFIEVTADPIHAPSAHNPIIGHKILAIVKNIGSSDISNADVQGMLFITKGTAPHFTASSTWQDFVNLPNGKIPPGGSIQWEYEPMPDSWFNKNLTTDQVHLEFMYRNQTQFSSASDQPPLVWKTPDALITQTRAFNNDRSGITVEASIENRGTTPLILSNTFALISFTTNQSVDLMPVNSYLFFADAKPNGIIGPGKQSSIDFQIIPVRGVDLSTLTPKVTLVSRD